MINRIPEVNPASSTYRVEEDYRISPKGNEILEGYLLRECYDGWYQVFTTPTDKHFFRIGPELFAKLKCSIYYGNTELQHPNSESKAGDIPEGQLFP